MENCEKSCRLCQNNIFDDFVLLIEIIREVLDVLLIKLTLDRRKNNAMCKSCRVKLFAAFEFKAVCLYTEDIIFPYISQKTMLPLDLTEIYRKENVNELIGRLGDKRICRLCMKLKNDEFSPLYDIKYMVIKFIPEVNMNSIKDPVICQSCYKELIKHYNFVKNCLETEEKIKNTSVKEVVAIQEGEEIDDRLTDKRKLKINKCDSYTGIQPPQNSYKPNQASKAEQKTITKFPQTKKCPLCECKTHVSSAHKDPSTGFYKCYMCDHTTKHYTNLKFHLLIHKDTSEILWFECDKCDYKSKYRRHLKRHMLVHKDVSEMEIYKCDKCLYRGKRLDHLKQHMLRHEDISQRKLFKCDQCDVKVISKSSLRVHMRTHMDPSEIEMYECTYCGHQSISKKGLNLHMVKHKDSSELPTFKCYLCDYETKRKGDLRQHMPTHMKNRRANRR